MTLDMYKKYAIHDGDDMMIPDISEYQPQIKIEDLILKISIYFDRKRKKF